jgi:hypothetical protein
MITGLLENQQKQREQQKQDTMAAYLGQAPGGHAGGDSKSGLLSGLGGMLQGMGGGADKPATDLGSPKYNDTAPAMGGGGLSKGTTSYLDDTFGAPGSANDDELL